nr:hypothetical protein [Moraxella osloensis]
MNQYKDTTQQPNTLERLKAAQNDNRTKVTLLDVVKSILLAVLMIGLLLLISSYHQAHPKNNLQSVSALFIAQHLAIDFLDCIDRQIESHPCDEVEGNA